MSNLFIQIQFRRGNVNQIILQHWIIYIINTIGKIGRVFFAGQSGQGFLPVKNAIIDGDRNESKRIIFFNMIGHQMVIEMRHSVIAEFIEL